MSRSAARPNRRNVTRARAGLLAGLVAGVGVIALTGCSSGQLAQTSEVKPAVPGANANAGPLALRNLTVLFKGGDDPTYQAGSDAPLVVRIANDGTGQDALTKVDSPDAGSVTLVGGTGGAEPSGSPSAAGTPSVAPTAGGTPSPTASAAAPAGAATFSVPLPARQLVQLLPDQGRYLMLTKLKHSVAPGTSVRVTFHFTTAGPVTVKIPVAPPEQVTARSSAPHATEPAEHPVQ